MEKKNTLRRRAPAAALVLGLGAAAFGLTACGEEPPSVPPSVKEGVPGTVVEHIDHPADASLILIDGWPRYIIYPEEFGLDIKQCERVGDPGADPQGCVTAEEIVTQETYNQYPDGSEIVIPKQ